MEAKVGVDTGSPSGAVVFVEERQYCLVKISDQNDGRKQIGVTYKIQRSIGLDDEMVVPSERQRDLKDIFQVSVNNWIDVDAFDQKRKYREN